MLTKPLPKLPIVDSGILSKHDGMEKQLHWTLKDYQNEILFKKRKNVATVTNCFFPKKKTSNETVSGKPYPVIKVMKRLIRQTDRQTGR